MNFIFGVIVGVLVTIGAAYVHDAAISGSDRDARLLVNWSAFTADMQSLNDDVSAAWHRLTDGVKSRD